MMTSTSGFPQRHEVEYNPFDGKLATNRFCVFYRVTHTRRYLNKDGTQSVNPWFLHYSSQTLQDTTQRFEKLRESEGQLYDHLVYDLEKDAVITQSTEEVK